MKGIRTNIGIEKVFEEQMRNWELRRNGDRALNKKSQPDPQGVKYVTLSYELGSQGEQVAIELQQMTGWQVYDKEILDYMAKDLHVHRRVLDSLDERRTSMIEEIIDSLSDESRPGYYSYKQHLTKVLMVIAEHGNAIIIGRAAGLVLPRQHGLNTRVISSFECRCRRYADDNDISLHRAEEVVADYDLRQKKFVKDFVHKIISDSVHYDLVLNSELLSPPAIAKIIYQALQAERPGCNMS
jgi:hypothetical protein